MNSLRALRPLALLAMAGLFCGCVSTSFQTAPLAAQACDPGLAGAWLSVDKEGKPDGEMRLQLSADCRLQVTDRSAGKEREGEPTTLSTAQRNGQSYAWINAGWTSRRFEMKELPSDSNDVIIFRYKVNGRQLDLEMIDHKLVAHRIIDGAIPGTVMKEENSLINRVTGPARPDLLDIPGLFEADNLASFQREGASP